MSATPSSLNAVPAHAVHRRGEAALATPRYDRVAVALHWAIAVGLIAQMVLGWWMLGVPKQPPGLRAGWFNLHKSVGIVLGLLVMARVGWRCAHRAPAWPATLSLWQQRGAWATHGLLYVLMVVMPLSGFLGSSFSGRPLRFFGLVLPAWAPAWPQAKKALASVHEASAWALAALVALHVAAALWHAAKRDGVLHRMWNWSSR